MKEIVCEGKNNLSGIVCKKINIINKKVKSIFLHYTDIVLIFYLSNSDWWNSIHNFNNTTKIQMQCENRFFQKVNKSKLSIRSISKTALRKLTTTKNPNKKLFLARCFNFRTSSFTKIDKPLTFLKPLPELFLGHPVFWIWFNFI